MRDIKVDLLVDAKGLSCPMPIIKVKKGMNQIESGQVVELQATDKGSMADIKAWSDSTGNQYLGSIEEDGIYRHFIRKSSSDNIIEKKYDFTISNDELVDRLNGNDNLILIDVRETAEYSFAHIPSSISIPLNEIDVKSEDLDKDKEVYVICRTGHRSDLAAQKLKDKGFKHVINVIPGMSEWNGSLEEMINKI